MACCTQSPLVGSISCSLPVTFYSLTCMGCRLGGKEFWSFNLPYLSLQGSLGWSQYAHISPVLDDLQSHMKEAQYLMTCSSCWPVALQVAYSGLVHKQCTTPVVCTDTVHLHRPHAVEAYMVERGQCSKLL